MFSISVQPLWGVSLDGFFNGLHVDFNPTHAMLNICTSNFLFGFLRKK